MDFDGAMMDIRPVTTDILQGPPIRPVLFLLHLRSLFDELQYRLLQAGYTNYNDNVVLTVTGRPFTMNSRMLGRGTEIMFDWASRNDVKFCNIKSELIHFHTSKNQDISAATKVTLPNRTPVAAGKVVR